MTIVSAQQHFWQDYITCQSPSHTHWTVQSLVAFTGLLKNSKHRFVILDNISGTIKPGRMTLLLGPPGAGKSTLLKTLANKMGIEGCKVIFMCPSVNFCPVSLYTFDMSDPLPYCQNMQKCSKACTYSRLRTCWLSILLYIIVKQGIAVLVTSIEMHSPYHNLARWPSSPCQTSIHDFTS